jgi:hypothetical protein
LFFGRFLSRIPGGRTFLEPSMSLAVGSRTRTELDASD